MNTQIYEEATDWIVKNREGGLDAQQKRQFDDWLRQSPEHVRAYLEMSTVWEGVSSLDPGSNAAAETLIAGAREQDNVIPWDVRTSASSVGSGASSVMEQPAGSCDGPRVARRPWTRNRAGPLTALAASVLGLSVGLWLLSERDTYVTDIGEQRSITLSDGSVVELNSHSRVRVRFSDRERDVELLAGQALFRVTRNPARPFVVFSDATRVRAVGTEFDVYRRRDGTIVTVVEGKVAASVVGSAGAAPNETAVLVSAGEQVTVTQAAVAPPMQANVASATAWTRHSWVFDSSPLADVVEEFNRYNRRQLVIQDPQLADVHVSGVFSSLDPALLIRFLRTQPDLRVDEKDREIVISKR